MQMIHTNEHNEFAVLAFLFSTMQTGMASLSQQNIDLLAEDEESDDQETDDEMNGDEEEVVNNIIGNAFLNQFWNRLPLEKTSEDIALKNGISFDHLFESSSTEFVKNDKCDKMSVDMETYEYIGSLTTPPFTEGVRWMVSKKIHVMHPDQLEKLPKQNNARVTQDYFG